MDYWKWFILLVGILLSFVTRRSLKLVANDAYRNHMSNVNIGYMLTDNISVICLFKGPNLFYLTVYPRKRLI